MFLDLHATQAEGDHLEVGRERRGGDRKHATLVRVRQQRTGLAAGELVVDSLDRDVHEGEVVGPFVRPDVLGRDRIDVLLDVTTELTLGELPLVVRLCLHEPDVVVQRELRVDRNRPIGPHDRIDALARVECVLHVVRGGREPVAQQVLEQELAEPPTRLRRPQSLLEPREILRPLEHLGRGLVHLPEPLVDLVRRLRGALESSVDFRVELRETPVHCLGHAEEVAVDLRVPLG